MTKKRVDRRVQRTRSLLNDAFIELIFEKGYDHVTIEDITERANLGRTTFYLHYQSKDELLLDHHDDFVTQLNLDQLSREEILCSEPQPEMVMLLQQLSQAGAVYEAFTKAKDAEYIMRNVHKRMMHNLRESLEAAFPGQIPTPPLGFLAEYIVGAQLSQIDRWIKSAASYNSDGPLYSPEEIATMLHQLRSAAVRDAYGVEATVTINE